MSEYFGRYSKLRAHVLDTMENGRDAWISAGRDG